MLFYANVRFISLQTLSQAVIKIDHDNLLQTDIDKLEDRLKAQRNIPFKPTGLGFMAIERSRRTGLPTVEIFNDPNKGKLYLDARLVAKRKNNLNRIGKAFFSNLFEVERLPFEMEDIIKSKGEHYSWLAVIHADGNNMGDIIRKMAAEISENSNEKFIDKFRQFSLAVDLSTKEAASESYAQIQNGLDPGLRKYPFRPVVMGGDDLTVICRADLALPYIAIFLEKFEQKTRFHMAPLNIKTLKNGLTACAGIAYIKNTYPFHFGYQLAEALCKHAKDDAKPRMSGDNGLTPSCVMFHKVLDSFVENFDEIISRELSSRNRKIRFDFGPYYLTKWNTVNVLMEKVGILNDQEGNTIRSALREYITDLIHNKEVARQKMERLLSVGSKAKLNELGLIGIHVVQELKDRGNEFEKSPFFDWLTIASINQGGN